MTGQVSLEHSQSEELCLELCLAPNRDAVFFCRFNSRTGGTGTVSKSVKVVTKTSSFNAFKGVFTFLRTVPMTSMTSGIDRQIRAGITSEMLPPLESSFTLFRPANPVVFNLYIAGFSRKSILTTQKQKIQDISEK